MNIARLLGLTSGARSAGEAWVARKRHSAHLNLSTFLGLIQTRFDADVVDYPGLYQWSIENPNEFWASVWLYCDIRAYVTWREVLTCPTPMHGARWFSGARLNYAENLLVYRDDTEALVFRGKDNKRTAVTYARLYLDVARLAAALGRHGIGEGDRVAAIVGNCPEAITAMLAAASIGAIWASCPQRAELDEVIACFGQISPKVLFLSGRDAGNGARGSWAERRGELIRRLPSLELVVVVGGGQGAEVRSTLPVQTTYRSLVAGSAETHLDFVRVPFDFPLHISFSATPSGKPNCVVHGAGGTLIQQLKELVLHLDVKRSDRIVSIASCGEMMWDYMASSLATGATLVLFDEAGEDIDGRSVLRAVHDEGATMLGAGGPHLAKLVGETARHRRATTPSPLRSLLASGASSPADLGDYANRCLKPGLRVSRMLTRPDIRSCLALANPMTLPHADEFQSCGLGMKVEVLDTTGRPLRARKGTLACSAAFPAMPIVIWEDISGARYFDAYFRSCPGVWSQGDCAEISAGGGVIFHPAAAAPFAAGRWTGDDATAVDAVGEAPAGLCLKSPNAYQVPWFEVQKNEVC